MKGPLLFKAKEPAEGYTSIISSENTGLKLLEFGRVYLKNKGKICTGETLDREMVLDILGGRCSVHVSGGAFGEVSYSSIGEREDPFSGKPTMVYLPRNARYEIASEAPNLNIGVFTAISEFEDATPALVRPKDVIVSSVGSWNWRRDVYTAIGENVKADKLIVGETINPPGKWSSYPPHKHDTLNPPKEAPYEEIYFFMLKPPQGFGIQRVYTAPDAEKPLDEVYVIENGDAIVVPRGYHPVAAAPGYRLFYLWSLAGEGRQFGAWSDDPKHAWIRNCEPIINELYPQETR